MKTRRDILTSSLALTVPPALGACSYGGVVDGSRVQSAVLSSDGRTVAFAYQELRYRPATGLAAFPDGGIPLYPSDRTVIQTAPTEGGPTRLLQAFQNRDAHGRCSVILRVFDTDPDHILVGRSFPVPQSGRSDLSWWRLSWRDGRVLPYPDVKRDLEARGSRFGSPKFGDLAVLDLEGALLIGAQTGGADELWLRPARGDYRRLVGPLDQYYGQRGDEVYYWGSNEAVVLNWRTGERRIVARYDPTARQTLRLRPDDPTVRVIERRTPASDRPTVSFDARSILVRWPGGRETRLAADTGPAPSLLPRR